MRDDEAAWEELGRGAAETASELVERVEGCAEREAGVVDVREAAATRREEGTLPRLEEVEPEPEDEGARPGVSIAVETWEVGLNCSKNEGAFDKAWKI